MVVTHPSYPAGMSRFGGDTHFRVISHVLEIRIVVVCSRVLSEHYKFEFTKDAAKSTGLDPNVQCPDIRLFDGARDYKFASLQQARRTPFDY